MFVSLKNPIYLHIFIHYSSIISNLCCFFQEQAKYWDVYPANVPSAIISDLEPGVEYSIDVMSINNMGESNFTLDPVIVRTSSKKIMLNFPLGSFMLNEMQDRLIPSAPAAVRLSLCAQVPIIIKQLWSFLPKTQNPKKTIL